MTLDRNHPKPMTPPAAVTPESCFAERAHELTGPLAATSPRRQLKSSFSEFIP
jgi:hypothetical protein